MKMMPEIHPLAERIIATGRTELPNGEEANADSFIPRLECEMIYRAVEVAQASRAIEVGMAYGVSSLCILDALSRTSPGADSSALPRMIAIDPAQLTDYQGAGVHLLRRAGLDSFFRLVPQPSAVALPELLRNGERARFAFIDGWHTFDHTLVDFFYIDQMLETGGIVVLDDVSYPAINAVVRFILTNRDYELTDTVPLAPVSRGIRFRRLLKRLVRPIARTDRDASATHDRLFRQIDDSFAVALLKRSDDVRRFDHFERF
jgi:predicted O-methyltransferase YrrM